MRWPAGDLVLGYTLRHVSTAVSPHFSQLLVGFAIGSAWLVITPPLRRFYVERHEVLGESHGGIVLMKAVALGNLNWVVALNNSRTQKQTTIAHG